MRTNALPSSPTLTSATPAAATGPTPATNPPAISDLNPILDPVRILDLRQILVLAAVTLLLAGLLTYLARLWWRRRQARLAYVPPPPPPLPAHERARLRLEHALRHLGDPDPFCTEHSLILREYIEERFGWNAPDRTSEEFLLQVRTRTELAADHQQLLQDFLTRCDFVKFARYEPTETELRALHQSAIRFVTETIPPPTPPPGAGTVAVLPNPPTAKS